MWRSAGGIPKGLQLFGHDLPKAPFPLLHDLLKKPVSECRRTGGKSLDQLRYVRSPLSRLLPETSEQGFQVELSDCLQGLNFAFQLGDHGIVFEIVDLSLNGPSNGLTGLSGSLFDCSFRTQRCRLRVLHALLHPLLHLRSRLPGSLLGLLGSLLALLSCLLCGFLSLLPRLLCRIGGVFGRLIGSRFGLVIGISRGVFCVVKRLSEIEPSGADSTVSACGFQAPSTW